MTTIQTIQCLPVSVSTLTVTKMEPPTSSSTVRKVCVMCSLLSVTCPVPWVIWGNITHNAPCNRETVIVSTLVQSKELKVKEISLFVTHKYSLKGTGKATLLAVLHDPKHNVGHPVHLFTKKVPKAIKELFIRVKML